jgi:hypothetical protein
MITAIATLTSTSINDSFLVKQVTEIFEFEKLLAEVRIAHSITVKSNTTKINREGREGVDGNWGFDLHALGLGFINRKTNRKWEWD